MNQNMKLQEAVSRIAAADPSELVETCKGLVETCRAIPSERRGMKKTDAVAVLCHMMKRNDTTVEEVEALIVGVDEVFKRIRSSARNYARRHENA